MKNNGTKKRQPQQHQQQQKPRTHMCSFPFVARILE